VAGSEKKKLLGLWIIEKNKIFNWLNILF